MAATDRSSTTGCVFAVRRPCGALFAIVRASAKDAIFRGPVLAVAVLGASAMISTRFTAIYGYGEETNLLLELGLANLSLGGAFLAVFCAIPVRAASTVLAADRTMVTRSLSPLTLLFGRWLGACIIVAIVQAFWVATHIAALAWFADAEPTIFTLDRDTTFAVEASRILTASSIVIVQTFLFAAVALACSVRGALSGPVAGVLALLVLGVLVPDIVRRDDAGNPVRLLSYVIPDLSPSSITQALYSGQVWSGAFSSIVLQGFGYGMLVLAIGARRMSRE